MLKALRQFAYKTLAKKSATLSFTVQKMKFSIKDFFSECDQILQWMWPTLDLVTITAEILNGKLHFLCNFFYLVSIAKLIKKWEINLRI